MDKYLKNKDAVIEQMDDLFVGFVGDMLNDPIVLNETSADILNFCNSEKSLEEIYSMINDSYDINENEANTITNDIIECINSLVKTSLLTKVT